MANVQPIKREDLPDLEPWFNRFEQAMGTVPNSLYTLAYRPEILQAFARLAGEISGRGVLDSGLKQLVGHVASVAAGCRYCQAHTASLAHNYGIDEAKIAVVWEFETNDLFSEAERAALRLARDAAQQPNLVTSQHFEELRPHFNQEQIVEMVAIISLFGFLNRWNETMATDLEETPMDFASRNLAPSGWEPGRHGG